MNEKQKLKVPKKLNKNLIVPLTRASEEIQMLNKSFQPTSTGKISPEHWDRLTEMNFHRIYPLLESLRKYDESN